MRAPRRHIPFILRRAAGALRLRLRSVAPLLLVVGASLGALLPGIPAPLRAQEPPLVVMLGSAPATLDPLRATDANGVRIAHQLIFETLVRLGDDLTVQPGLANWERLSPTRYRFTVQAERRFHSGAPLTAVDAVATLERILDPAFGSPYGGVLRDEVATVRKTGALTFEVTLKAPVAGFLSHLILPVVPRDLGAGEPAVPSPWGDLNGSGPFRYTGQAVGELTLARNEAHPRPAGVARVVFKIVKDESTRLLKFRKGDTQLGINVLPLEKLLLFQRRPLRERFGVVEAPGLSFQYLGLNLRDPILADVRVRQALAQAIPVDALIQYRQRGHSVRATGLLPPESPYAPTDLKPWPHDPEAAARLLDAAGYPLKDGRRFALTYKTTTDRHAVIQARVVADALRDLGIEVEVRSYEWGTFYGDIKSGNFQLYSLRWIGVADPDFLYELLHSNSLPPDGKNRGYYANARVDTLLEQARRELDQARRVELYRAVQRIVYEELPFIPLWHNHNVAVVSHKLTGFRLHPTGGFEHLPELRWAAPPTR